MLVFTHKNMFPSQQSFIRGVLHLNFLLLTSSTLLHNNLSIITTLVLFPILGLLFLVLLSRRRRLFSCLLCLEKGNKDVLETTKHFAQMSSVIKDGVLHTLQTLNNGVTLCRAINGL